MQLNIKKNEGITTVEKENNLNMVNDKHFNHLENEMLSLSFIESIKIEDEEHKQKSTLIP